MILPMPERLVRRHLGVALRTDGTEYLELVPAARVESVRPHLGNRTAVRHPEHGRRVAEQVIQGVRLRVGLEERRADRVGGILHQSREHQLGKCFVATGARRLGRADTGNRPSVLTYQFLGDSLVPRIFETTHAA